MVDQAYATYTKWRSHHSDVRGQEHLARLFEAEFTRLKAPAPPARVFEVGFGPGDFLRWAQSKGYSVTGCEVIPEYVQQARLQGFEVVEGAGDRVIRDVADAVDIFVALDVFEHLSADEGIVLLTLMRQSLRPGGKVLIRVPNGGSPFGRLHQHGDVTHRTVHTGNSMRQMAEAAGLEFLYADNSARDLKVHRPLSVLKPVAYLVRNSIEHVLGRLYYGHRVPLDYNLSIGLARLPEQSQ